MLKTSDIVHVQPWVFHQKKWSAFYYVAYESVESPACRQWHTVIRSIRWYTSHGFFCPYPFFVFFLSLYVTLLVFYPSLTRFCETRISSNDFNIKVVFATSKSIYGPCIVCLIAGNEIKIWLLKALEMKLPKIAVFLLNDQYNHFIKRKNVSDVSIFPRHRSDLK